MGFQEGYGGLSRTEKTSINGAECTIQRQRLILIEFSRLPNLPMLGWAGRASPWISVQRVGPGHCLLQFQLEDRASSGPLNYFSDG